jgi:hypothetical protein
MTKRNNTSFIRFSGESRSPVQAFQIDSPTIGPMSEVYGLLSETKSVRALPFSG